MSEEKELINEENSSDEVLKTDIVSRFRKNPWMIASVVLGILLIVVVFSNYVTTGNVVLNGKVVGENLAQFLSEGESGQVNYLTYKEEGNLYQISVEFEGEIYELYASKDGKYYLPYVIPIEKQVITQTTQTNTQTQSSYSEQDLIKISEFMQCLASKNVRIYGANWCGYTNQIANNLGGYEVISPIYVECTQNEELCASEGIQGFPTIKIDGAQVNIARTLQGFADATGCLVPEVSTVQSNSATASC